MLFGLLALATAAFFSGAAVYVNVAEQPARLTLDDKPLLAEWKPAYKHGAVMQASLAIASFILGLIAWWQTGEAAFAIGAVLIIANWPWTLTVIMPVNKALKATAPADAGPQTRAMIVKWGKPARGALGARACRYARLSCRLPSRLSSRALAGGRVRTARSDCRTDRRPGSACRHCPG